MLRVVDLQIVQRFCGTGLPSAVGCKEVSENDAMVVYCECTTNLCNTAAPPLVTVTSLVSLTAIAGFATSAAAVVRVFS